MRRKLALMRQLGTNVFTCISPSQDSKPQKSKKKLAEFAAREHGSEQHELIPFGQEAEFEEPAKPTSSKARDISDHKQERDFCLAQKEKHRQDKAKSFMLIVGQCVHPLRTVLESRTEFPARHQKEERRGGIDEDD